MKILIAVPLTDEDIAKLLSILECARRAAIDMREPEVSAEIGRLYGILNAAVAKC